MNVLYILGNGFDLAQGLATDYPSFYSYLRNAVRKRSPLLDQMLDEIKSDTQMWADMEKALGLFTSKIDNADDFTSFYEELSDNLQRYLERETSTFDFSENTRKMFRQRFFSPLTYLQLETAKAFANSSKLFTENARFYVMSLNFTNTLEKLLDPSKLQASNPSKPLQEVVHVHGQLGESIIFGVDNVGQIAKEEFRQNEDVKDFLLKSQSGTLINASLEATCKTYIQNANLIILYGVSLGKTDDQWWKLIAEHLKNRKDLVVVLHVYEPTIKPTLLQKTGKFYREQMCRFLEPFGISTDKYKSDFTDRFLFVTNKDIFDFQKNKISRVIIKQ